MTLEEISELVAVQIAVAAGLIHLSDQESRDQQFEEELYLEPDYTSSLQASLCARGGGGTVRRWLFKQLNVEDRDARCHAARALAHVAPTHHGASRALANAVSDPDPDVCEAAARALSAVGPSHSFARDALIAALEDSRRTSWHRPVWEAALDALRPLATTDRTVRDLFLEHLRTSDGAALRIAIEALAPRASTDTVVRNALAERSADGDLSVRIACLNALADAALEYPDVEHVLVAAIPDLLSDQARYVSRYRAFQLFGSIHTLSKRSTPVRQAVFEVIRGNNLAHTRSVVTSPIREAAAEDEEVRQEIIGRTESDSEVEVAAALRALRDAADQHAEVLETVLRHADSEASAIRRGAADGLGGAAVHDPGALDTLLHLADDEDPWVRREALEALGPSAATHPKAREKILGVLLPDDQKIPRKVVVYEKRTHHSLGGPIERIDAKDEYDLEAAISALSAITVHDREACDLLIMILGNNTSNHLERSLLEAVAGAVLTNEDARLTLIDYVVSWNDHMSSYAQSVVEKLPIPLLRDAAVNPAANQSNAKRMLSRALVRSHTHRRVPTGEVLTVWAASRL